MGNNLRRLACVVALLALEGAGVFAQPPERGKVAILDNDRIIEGDIERLGDQYRVRRAVGETWLAGDKVRRLCATMPDALAYVRSQANLNDPDERLRLARWCLAQSLRTEAIVELEAAADMRPSHVETQRMLKGLQRTVVSDPPPAPPAKDEPTETTPELPTGAYNPAALGTFVNKVQPILMNACASCHANNKGGSFTLMRGFDDGKPANRKTTQHNLAAVLNQVNRLRPADSPLLQKALMLHGGADHPPLKSPNAPAFRYLSDWVFLAMTNVPIGDMPVPVTRTPQPPPAAPVFASTPAATENRVFAAEAAPVKPAEPAPPAAKPVEAAPAAVTAKPTDQTPPVVQGASWAAQLQAQTQAPKPASPSDFAEPAPATTTVKQTSNDEADDPFDPVIFNRQR